MSITWVIALRNTAEPIIDHAVADEKLRGEEIYIGLTFPV